MAGSVHQQPSHSLAGGGFVLREIAALVIANGDLAEPDVIRQRLAAFAPRWVIAADGGSLHARTLNLHVDVLIGDLDSIQPAQAERLRADGAQIIPHPPGKDETDLELALLQACALGASEIVVLGAVGGRLDMTLSNVMLLLHPNLRRAQVVLWHGRQTAFVLRSPGGSIPARYGDGVSLIPLGGDAIGVRTRGLAFPLNGEVLHMSAARGVSNVATDEQACVAFEHGALLVVVRPDAGSTDAES
jgi:thiamine pyrophosphokinase